MKRFKVVVTITAIFLLLAPFIYTNRIFDGRIWGPTYYVIVISAFLLLYISVLLIFRNKPYRLIVNPIDVILFTIIAYIGIRLLFTPYGQAYIVNYIILDLFLFFYLSLKHLFSSPGSMIFLYFIIAVFLMVAMVEVVYGFLQLTGIILNSNHEFRIGGTFGNPGPYTNYLVVVLPFALGCFLYLKPTETTHKKVIRYFSLVVSLSIIAILPFTGARTSWLASAVGILVIIMPVIKPKKIYRVLFGNVIKRIVTAGLLCVMIIFVILMLYHYKPQSVKGRLLIYEVSCYMVKDKPLLGIGFGRFVAEYNNYQADYFKSSPQSNKAIVASNIKTGFNEFLLTWIELGLIGLLLLITLIVAIFLGKSLPTMNFIAISVKGALAALLVCCCFSYPLGVLAGTVNIVMLLAIGSAAYAGRTYTLHFSKTLCKLLSLLLIIISLSTCYLQWKDLNARIKWNKAIVYAGVQNYQKALPIYREIYPKLKYDGLFLYNYGAELSEIDTLQSIKILEEASKYLSDNDLYVYLGDGYKGIKNYIKAEDCYILSSNMVPNKFYPRYQLFKLYCETGQFNKAFQVAQAIAQMDIKVPSGTVYAIKDEINKWLKQHKM